MLPLALLVGAIGFFLMFKVKTAAKVLHRERAFGVAPQLIAFLDAWEHSGEFDITVGRDGGLRTSEELQKELYRAGKTRAYSLKDTPHGRGGALDVYPADYKPDDPSLESKHMRIGEFAERMGLQWGGRWRGFHDAPHIEVPNWQRMPFPPKMGVV